MIRVVKSTTIPESLSRAGNTEYNHQDVQSQLLTDQHGKCYLCERICVTDYEIEHLKSQQHHPGLKCEWSNLFLACSYCNGKKLNNYDNILNPLTNNIEEIIACRHDIAKKKVDFTATNAETEEILLTIQLLKNVFNGNGNIRKAKEERFYEYFQSRINHFLSLVVKFLSDNSPENRQAVEEQLQMSNEFLAFKYDAINARADLAETFQSSMTWNR